MLSHYDKYSLSKENYNWYDEDWYDEDWYDESNENDRYKIKSSNIYGNKIVFSSQNYSQYLDKNINKGMF